MVLSCPSEQLSRSSIGYQLNHEPFELTHLRSYDVDGMNGRPLEFLIQFLPCEVLLTWICVSDVGQALNACFLVQTSTGLCLNKGLLVALQWMVSKYLPLVLRETKRYCTSIGDSLALINSNCMLCI